MKKLSILSVALSAALFTGVASANPTAYDGQINFTGKVVDQTCVVSNSTTTKNLTVKLPTVSKSVFNNTAGSTAGSTGFTIDLEHCKASTTSGVSKVRLFFLPTLTASSNLSKSDLLHETQYVLKNKANSAANNVGIQILDSTLTPVKLGENISNYNESDKVSLSTSEDSNVSLQYHARYYAVTGDVGTGDVQAAVQYNIVYD